MNRNIDSQLLSGLLSGLVIGAAVGVTVGYLVATEKRGPLSDERIDWECERRISVGCLQIQRKPCT